MRQKRNFAPAIGYGLMLVISLVAAALVYMAAGFIGTVIIYGAIGLALYIYFNHIDDMQ